MHPGIKKLFSIQWLVTHRCARARAYIILSYNISASTTFYQSMIWKYEIKVFPTFVDPINIFQQLANLSRKKR